MKKAHQILLHIAFWLFFNILQYARYVALNYGNISAAFYLMVCVQITLNLITFYGAYFMVFTNVFRYPKFKSLGIASVFMITNIVFRVYVSRYVFLFVEVETWLDKYNSVWLQTLFVITYTGLSFLVRFTIHWFYDQQIKNRLINENQAGELALLRAQINPHFLFNTLNNIYSLALQNSKDTAVSIARLSEIMRYMLKEPETEKVPLDKEIEYLKSFIELHKLRFKHEDFIEFRLDGDLSGNKIAPMILIHFVENAFKHGTKQAESPGIVIKLSVKEKVLKMNVVNFCKDNSSEAEGDSNGIGINNVKRRLELIYSGRYKLTMNKNSEKNKFEVDLTIEL